MDIDVSTEEPPAQAAPEPPAETAPAAVAPAQSNLSGNGPALVIIGVIIAVALVVFVVSQAGSWFAPRPHNEAYLVQPYTPPSQLISAGDHVLAHARPELTSPGVVMFGPGVALTITGRVSRGFGDDWYAIAWNGQTAFIRQQDARPGVATAPPPTAAHVAAPPHEVEKPDVQDQTGFPDLAPAPPAPESGPFELSGVRWSSRPGRRDVERAYPSRALYENQSGHVTLDCVAAASGALDCSVGTELPRGYGFGAAALSLSRQFRLEPTTSDGRSVAGGHIQVPVEFRAN
ncbi:MAG: energy transducer TonB [Proteobacteria bacterium]|nr:energy transducer TonB [Pseudomonadota bacterium]